LESAWAQFCRDPGDWGGGFGCYYIRSRYH